ncbi:MAG: sensor histidine kinase [Micromonosporaceae bacterium]
MGAGRPAGQPQPPLPRWLGWAGAASFRDLFVATVITAIVIGGTIGSQNHQHGIRLLDAIGVALLVVISAAMIPRRRYPAVTLIIVGAGVSAYFSLGYAWGPVFIPLVIAIGSAVLAGYRLLAWLACAVMYFFVSWGGYYLGGVGHRPGLSGVITNAAWPLLILIGAEMVRAGRERAVSAARSRAELSRRRASEERLRMAQELHDVLAHNISLISVQAGVALHLMDERPDQAAQQARSALTAIRYASKEALGELRSVLGMLRSPSDEQAPLSPVPGMEQLGELTSRATAAGLAVSTEVTGDRRPLPARTDLAAYRIVQEALTNVIRHAGARNVAVRVSYGDTSLGIEIEDDGGGDTGDAEGMAEASTAGNGIAGMRERTRLLGGELTARPMAGRGFLVRARLPLGNGRGDGAGQAGGAGQEDRAGSAVSQTAAAEPPHAPDEADPVDTSAAGGAT